MKAYWRNCNTIDRARLVNLWRSQGPLATLTRVSDPESYVARGKGLIYTKIELSELGPDSDS